MPPKRKRSSQRKGITDDEATNPTVAPDRGENTVQLTPISILPDSPHHHLLHDQTYDYFELFVDNYTLNPDEFILEPVSASAAAAATHAASSVPTSQRIAFPEEKFGVPPCMTLGPHPGRCSFCDTVFWAKNPRSVWKRHVHEEHGVALKRNSRFQPRTAESRRGESQGGKKKKGGAARRRKQKAPPAKKARKTNLKEDMDSAVENGRASKRRKMEPEPEPEQQPEFQQGSSRDGLCPPVIDLGKPYRPYARGGPTGIPIPSCGAGPSRSSPQTHTQTQHQPPSHHEAPSHAPPSPPSPRRPRSPSPATVAEWLEDEDWLADEEDVVMFGHRFPFRLALLYHLGIIGFDEMIRRRIDELEQNSLRIRELWFELLPHAAWNEMGGDPTSQSEIDVEDESPASASSSSSSATVVAEPVNLSSEDEGDGDTDGVDADSDTDSDTDSSSETGRD